MNDWNRKIIEEFRSNQGNVGGMFEGAPMLILHTRGAKTGVARENPLMYRQDGERVVIFASKGGAPTNPDWYHNILSAPIVRVEIGAGEFEAKATVAQGKERDRLWTAQKSEYPQFAQYEANTKREIPVIVLNLAPSS